jgi:hypothetical protein
MLASMLLQLRLGQMPWPGLSELKSATNQGGGGGVGTESSSLGVRKPPTTAMEPSLGPDPGETS